MGLNGPLKICLRLQGILDRRLMEKTLTGRVVLEQVAAGEPGASHGGVEASHTESRLQVGSLSTIYLQESTMPSGVC